MDSIQLDRALCSDLLQAERREWWLANALGAYAAGTVAGSLTRRYHGLLIAPVEPPLGRRLLLAKADTTLSQGDAAWPLFVNRWTGAAPPAAPVYLHSFTLQDGVPVWRFAIRERWLEMRIWMEPGANTTYVAWRLDSTPDADQGWALHCRLLVNNRDHHASTRLGQFQPVIEADAGELRVIHPQGPTLLIRSATSQFNPDNTWYQDYFLPMEALRGLDAIDHHLCAGELTMKLIPGEWCGFVASIETDVSTDLEEALQRSQQRTATVLARASTLLQNTPDWIQQLILAADRFVIARPLQDSSTGESVIAGYPWFGGWGRDTMIALPGLTLATGRHDSARRILSTFASFVSEGMLPNVFPGAGEAPQYNSVDAALWYIEAWRAYYEASNDHATLSKVCPLLESIIEAYCRGTRYGIGCDSDGLLRAGQAGIQLTWMDAKVGEHVMTPRMGKPVEVNALWYNALCVLADFADDFATDMRHDSKHYRDLATQVASGFQRFIKADKSGLYDVLDGPEGNDASIRPNQIFAVSLPHSPLDADDQRRIVIQCARELLTPYGLRSLAPSEVDYRGHYGGDVWQRDSAYHQGPVWGWLLGHYALAEYRVHGDARRALARLEPIAGHLHDAGLGTLSEIFDGEAPHTPRGAPAQAWSVACILEAWWRLQTTLQE